MSTEHSYAVPEESQVLPVDFYSRDTVTVAKTLLGKILRSRSGRAWRSGFIVEDEAYLRDDPASHSYKGRTKRNSSMFGPPGTAYVYRIHQVYCLNVVTQSGEAVLLRALEPLERVMTPTNGPGRICKALGITRETHDGTSLTESDKLQILGGRDRSGDFSIGVSRRIGISKAVEAPLRFYIRGNKFLSRRSRSLTIATLS